MNLEFTGVPSQHVTFFLQVVCDTLSQLGLVYDYDEVSATDVPGECDILIGNVHTDHD